MSLPLLELLPEFKPDFVEGLVEALEPRDDEREGGVFAIANTKDTRTYEDELERKHSEFEPASRIFIGPKIEEVSKNI